MKHDLWKAIKDTYPDYWSHRIRLLPDGYGTAIDQLFRDVEQISGGRQLIEIEFRHYAAGGVVPLMTPRTDTDEITDRQKAQLFDLLRSWSKASATICQVCGQPAAGVLKFTDRAEQEILCAEHLEERRSSDG